MAKGPNLVSRIAVNPEELFLRLGQLLDTIQVLDELPLTQDANRWLAQALVLVEAAGDLGDFVQLKGHATQLTSHSLHGHARSRIVQIVHNALARAEIGAPVSLQGSFLPVGNPHDALVAIAKVMSQAKQTILLVDPYADANILTTYAIQAAEGVGIEILTDAASVKPSLKPAATTWCAQYGADRGLAVRLSAARTLHDRLIVIDGAQVWLLGQSFNALAVRSPTVVTRLDDETAKLKLAAYASVWASAAPL